MLPKPLSKQAIANCLLKDEDKDIDDISSSMHTSYSLPICAANHAATMSQNKHYTTSDSTSNNTCNFTNSSQFVFISHMCLLPIIIKNHIIDEKRALKLENLVRESSWQILLSNYLFYINTTITISVYLTSADILIT